MRHDRHGGVSLGRAVPPVETATLRLSDGEVLAADVYRPAADGTYPVLLMRQPYGKAIASTAVLAHPAWYAAHGYVVVVQDVRGTGESTGRFRPFETEAADGAETLTWARALPGGNGQIGTYGFSYQGTTQFLTLCGGARPDAMAVSMGSFDPEIDWATEGGLFRAATGTGWAAQMARLAATRDGDTETLAGLNAARSWQETFDFLVERPAASHLAAWIKQGGAGHEPAHSLAGHIPPVPLLQVAGTADFLLRGALAADQAFRAVSPDRTHLILTEWPHMPWGSATSEPFSVDRAQIAFFDYYLKGKGAPPCACLAHEAGTGRWVVRDPAALQAPGTLKLHLHSDGLAVATVDDGQLAATESLGFDDILVHDPSRSAPLVGGAAGTPPGPAERSAIDRRADVACYTGPKLDAPLRLFGRGSLTLSMATDGPHPGIAASLSRVRPDGSADVLSSAVAAITTDGAHVTFDALSACLHPGDALRVSIQAAPFPDYLPRPFQALTDPGLTPTTMTIRHAGSTLCLPVCAEDQHHA